MAYVYEHIRKDTGEVFYVGIGSDKLFKRAFALGKRNYLWNEVVAKAGYEVKIRERDIDWEKACEIEMELICKYGRLDLGTGSLTNLTEGGEGFKRTHTESTKNKIRNTTKGKTYEERYGLEKALELRQERSKRQKQIWDSRSKEKVSFIADKISKSGTGKLKVYSKTKCPHCGKTGLANLMSRWHFDRCTVLTGEVRVLSEEHKAALRKPKIKQKIRNKKQ